jgi:hypothetical protein
MPIGLIPVVTQLKMESPSYYFEGVVQGSNVYTKDIVDDLDEKQGQGFMSADDLEEIDIGCRPPILEIGNLLCLSVPIPGSVVGTQIHSWITTYHE